LRHRFLDDVARSVCVCVCEYMCVGFATLLLLFFKCSQSATCICICICIRICIGLSVSHTQPLANKSRRLIESLGNATFQMHFATKVAFFLGC